MPVSSWFLMPSPQLGSVQRPLLQMPLAQSRAAVHTAFLAQRVHLLLPPQSMSDSFESLSPFAQAGSMAPPPPLPVPPGSPLPESPPLLLLLTKLVVAHCESAQSVSSWGVQADAM